MHILELKYQALLEAYAELARESADTIANLRAEYTALVSQVESNRENSQEIPSFAEE